MMKRQFEYLFISLIIAMASACATNPEYKQHKAEYFSLSIPDSFDVVKTVPVEDFEIHTIGKSGKPYVGIYVGNHPKRANISDYGKDNVTVLRSSNVEYFSVWNMGKLAHREVVFDLQRHRLPQYVQAWTFDLRSSDLLLADRILSSIDVVREE